MNELIERWQAMAKEFPGLELSIEPHQDGEWWAEIDCEKQGKWVATFEAAVIWIEDQVGIKRRERSSNSALKKRRVSSNFRCCICDNLMASILHQPEDNALNMVCTTCRDNRTFMICSGTTTASHATMQDERNAQRQQPQADSE